MKLRLLDSRLGLRNSTTRIPFRYGSACLTRCPQAAVEATVEVDGRVQAGYSGDCLPPSWFDKTPGKPYRQQIADMLAVITQGQAAFADAAARPITFFDAWLAAYEQVHAWAGPAGFNPLLAGFGVSLVERAIIDALLRAAGMSLSQGVRANILAIRPAAVHRELEGLQPADWLPARPAESIFVRHTVGLCDPLTAADIPAAERLGDGFPQALEEYILTGGLRYFKVKITADLQQTYQRLLAVADLCRRHLGDDYHLTLDGNEQFKSAEEFLELIETLRATPRLSTLLANTLCIEQPLARDIALEPGPAAAIGQLARWKPAIIDESDGRLDSYSRAIRLGYRGVSSKNCKGPVKSLLNAGLTWLANGRQAAGSYLMTGEDLCSVGVVAMQSDIALVAALGLSHIERNGHHYHPGLSYLPAAEQEAALARHGDLYFRQQGRVAPRLAAGRFHIASLERPGYGFSVPPNMAARQAPTQWSFDSLGLNDQ